MLTVDRVAVPLRILLALTFVGLVIAQLMSIPGQFTHMAARSPELGFVPWLLLAFAILEVVCLQVVIVCTWRLLTLVRADRIFSTEAFAWVDGILWAMVAGWVMLVAVAATLVGFIYVTPEIRDPGIPILLTGMVLISGVLVFTMVVLRALLRQAAVLRSDLEEVV
jgi:hypothetical protein